jgi:protein tyrosine/serine phosphatase
MLAFLVATAILHHRLAPYHFLEVEEGVLYRSGTLRPHNLRSVIDRFGIRTVVNLRSVDENTQPWHAEQERVCREKGISLVDLPMLRETPPTERQVDAWLRLLADRGRKPILVHCQHGVVRTGMMVAVFEAAYRGKGGFAILRTLPMFGHRLWGPHRKPMRGFILSLSPGTGESS